MAVEAHVLELATKYYATSRMVALSWQRSI